ncbi:MAG: hypothetical protein LBB59_05415 [Campylobacteraceae bacterium]|jgi:hypothetical protein|nr:hypothetical protein [Campylobacteraceae bacterium]
MAHLNKENIPMKKLLKKIILIIGLSPFIAIFLYFGLNYAGFCFEQCRFLSDEEKIDAAIRTILGTSHNVKDENGSYHTAPAYNMPYLKIDKYGRSYSGVDENIDNFKAENPNCCSLSKFYYKKDGSIYKISFFARAFGMTSDFVTVKFKYKNINGEEEVGVGLVPISNCGRYELSVNESLDLS